MSSYADYLPAQLNQKNLEETAELVSGFDMYPYFNGCHYIITALAVKEDTSKDGFNRRHPLSCWVSTMLMCFAGGVLGNFLLGDPVINVLLGNREIVLATAIWYLVNYFPVDLFGKIAKFLPIWLFICSMKEIRRAHSVYSGVKAAYRRYPHGYCIMVLMGSKGAGSNVMRTFEQVVRGVWHPTNNEILRPRFAFKSCIVAAAVFTVDLTTDYIPYSSDLVFLGVVVFFVYFKLNSLLFGIEDPFAPFENVFCAVFMGGISDALRRAVERSRRYRERNGLPLDTSINDVGKKER